MEPTQTQSIAKSATTRAEWRFRYDQGLIIDIGMHRGADTDFYLKKGFRVVAVEANPFLADRGRQRFTAEIAEGRLNLLNIGIGDKAGEFDFFVNQTKDDWSSFEPDWNQTMRRPGTQMTVARVKCVTLDELLADVGIPYYLKIDIEGNDICCLKALQRVDILPPLLSVELKTFNNQPGAKTSYLDNLCHLAVLGYRQFKIVDQSKHNSVRCPNPPLEGQYVDATFDGYSSGPFGEEAPGQWRSLEAVMFDYLEYLRHPTPPAESSGAAAVENDGYTGSLDRNGWFDVHAKR